MKESVCSESIREMERPLKTLILWARLPSYLAGFCQRLYHVYGHEVVVAGLGGDQLTASEAPFSETLYQGIETVCMNMTQIRDDGFICDLVESHRPDLLAISGWQFPTYRNLYFRRRFAHIPKILCSDNIWRGTFKQRIGRILLPPLLRRATRIWVPGVRGHELMHRWGVEPSKVVSGLYNVDADLIRRPHSKSPGTAREKRFLFVGQLINRKGFDQLIQSYRRYRSEHSAPWDLVVCGRGPLEPLCQTPGIDYRGFVDGAALPDILAAAEAFVLPSLYDPWGVAIAEAACAGLPIIASEGCGAAADLLRDGENGYLLPVGDSQALYRAMCRMHALSDADRTEMGRLSESLAEPFTADNVAKKMDRLMRSLRN